MQKTKEEIISEVKNTQLIQVQDIKAGMLVVIGSKQYYADSDAYLYNGIWSFDFQDIYRYGFTHNGSDTALIEEWFEGGWIKKLS